MTTQMESDKPRRPYGRVYMHFGTNDPQPVVPEGQPVNADPMHCYMARIWDLKGVDIWHGKALTADDAYAVMRAYAATMNTAVDLYRNDAGATITETVFGTSLPF